MTVEQKVREYVREAIKDALGEAAGGTQFKCNDCDKKFRASLLSFGDRNCPKCGSPDTDLVKKNVAELEEGCKEGAGEEAEALADGTKQRLKNMMDKLMKLAEPELRKKRKAINIALDDIRTGKTHWPPGKEESKTRATKGLEVYLKLVVLAMDAQQGKAARGVKSEEGMKEATPSGIKSAVDRGIISHVECNNCGKVFKVTKSDAKCPKCNRSDFDIA